MSRDYGRYTASQTQAIRPALPALFSCLPLVTEANLPSSSASLIPPSFYLWPCRLSFPLSLSLYSLFSFQYRHCLVEAIESAPSRTLIRLIPAYRPSTPTAGHVPAEPQIYRLLLDPGLRLFSIDACRCCCLRSSDCLCPRFPA
jgi:hypothetical protein